MSLSRQYGIEETALSKPGGEKILKKSLWGKKQIDKMDFRK
jgi:hypothetical protein